MYVSVHVPHGRLAVGHPVSLPGRGRRRHTNAEEPELPYDRWHMEILPTRRTDHGNRGLILCGPDSPSDPAGQGLSATGWVGNDVGNREQWRGKSSHQLSLFVPE